ncbi:MAG: hypothetical protein EOP88_25645 [Verrucomicrobiaceae bacterium]|nr:MAG: hypothetical protein EOP88_25645 [Verrucomicrobiaceae bacterium]
MVRKCCPACSGIGSYYGTEWVRDDSRAFEFKRITIRKNCDICSGSGQLGPEKALHNQRCVTRMPGPPAPSGMPADLDTLLTWSLSASLFGYLVFSLAKEPFLLAGGTRWGIALLAALFLPWCLKRVAGSARGLRRVAMLGFLVAVSGGIVFEFALR